MNNLVRTLAYFLASFLQLWSQGVKEEPIDFSLWSGIKVVKEVNASIDIYGKLEYRQRENLLLPRNYFFQTGIKYTPINGLDLSFAYRWDERYRLKQETFFTNHRFQFAAELYKRWGRFKLTLRNQFQVRHSTRGNDKYPWRMFQRERLMLTYNWPDLPLKTNGFVECWFPINVNRGTFVSKVRFGITQDIQIGENHELTVGGYLNLDQRPDVNRDEFALLIRYTLRLPNH
jgi:hypothetical protein